MRRNRWWWPLVLTLSLSLLAPAADAAKKKDEDQIYRDLDLFVQSMKLVRDKYVDEDKTASRQMIYDAIDGMIGKLDPYSDFMDPQDFKDMREETQGSFGGLGIEIGLRDGWLTVIAPIEGTPAEAAGIKAGDKIIKIDGKYTEGLTIMDAVHKLRGAKGTKVALLIARASQPEPLNLTVTRDTIKIESIRSYLLSPDIGYVRLSEFSQNAGDEFRAAVEGLRQEVKGDGGLRGLIIDLRNNPGGLLLEAVKVAENVLPAGSMIVYTRGRMPESNVEYKAQRRQLLAGVPLVVLVNNGSASASEILAGAVQDNGRGLVMGSKTFGKASVQTIYPLEDSEAAIGDGQEQGAAALRLTTAKYFTPKGQAIHDVGITPDVVVEPVKHTEAAARLLSGDYIAAFAKDYLSRAEIRTLEKGKRSEVTDAVFEEFLKYMRRKEYVVTAETIGPDEQFIRDNIAVEFCRLEVGEAEARRLMVEKDPLTNKAIEMIKGYRFLRSNKE